MFTWIIKSHADYANEVIVYLNIQLSFQSHLEHLVQTTVHTEFNSAQNGFAFCIRSSNKWNIIIYYEILEFEFQWSFFYNKYIQIYSDEQAIGVFNLSDQLSNFSEKCWEHAKF